MAKDRALELLELGARLDPELVDEHRSGFAVCLERLGLPTGRVERPHQRGARAFAERMLANERLQLPHELRVPPESEVGVDP